MLVSDIAFLALMGGVVIVDTTAFGQFLLSQPLIACTILGWLVGDVSSGMLIGIINQLLWLRLVPLGGSVHLQGNFAAIVGGGTTCLLLKSGIPGWYGPILVGLTFGILCGHLAGYLVPLHRNWNGWLVSSGGSHPSPRGVSLRQTGAVVTTFCGGAVLTVMMVIPAVYFCVPLLENGSVPLESAGMLAVPASLGVGLVTVLQMFCQRRYGYWVIVGACGAAAILWLT